MFIVRGINVYPLAVGTVIAGFRPQVNGEFQVVLRDAPPHERPPLVRVELAGRHRWTTPRPPRWPTASRRGSTTCSCSRRRSNCCRPRRLPRTETKARRIVRAYREDGT